MSHVIIEQAATSSLSPSPAVPAYSDSLEWITAYLVAHMMSNNSRRYAYILWICIGVFFLIGCLFRWASIRGGYLGAKWSKWALRRRTWRGKSFRERSRKMGQPVSLPSNGQLLCLATLPVVVFLLSFLGPDYISPTVEVFDLPSTGLSTRATGYDISWFVQFQPQYTINKGWWTAGGRTGIIAFALMPLCILFVLKAPPFALFALPFTIQIHFDKLAWLHRWSARLIWLITFLHVVLWSVQLSLDRRQSTGKIAYTYAWQYQKFIFGWIAFGLMTLLIFSSTRSLRKSHYETFYAFHVVLVPLALVMSALHHPPLWIWCWIALGLWVGERAWRATWWLQINGFFGTDKFASAALIPPKVPPVSSDARSRAFPPPSPYLDSKFSGLSNGSLLAPASAITYSPPPGFARAELLSGATVRLTFIAPGFSYWAPGQHFLINIPSVSRFVTHPFTAASISDEQSPLSAGRAMVLLVRSKKGWTRDLWDHVSRLISCGHNHAPDEKPPNGTVMPSTGVLLKMYVEGPFGSVVRTRWESYSTIVVFVAGSGVSFGLSILQYVCLCLAGRDGKYLGGRAGSWGTTGFRTRRVRFVWLIKEYAHIHWCSSILRRCMAMIPSPGLDMDIFVTNFKPPTHLPPPPRPPRPSSNDDENLLTPPSSRSFVKTPVFNNDTDSDMSEDSDVDLSYYTGEFGDEEPDLSGVPISERENYTLDLTNWEDDNDASLPGEDQLNSRIHKEGKRLRRTTRMSMALNSRRQFELDAKFRKSNLLSMHANQASTDALLPSVAEESRSSIESDLGLNRNSMYSIPESDAYPMSPRSSVSLAPSYISNDHSSTRSKHFSRPPSYTPSTSHPFPPFHSPKSSTRLTIDTSFPADFKRPPKSAVSDFIPDRRSINPLLHVEGQEMRDLNAISERVRPGKAKLDRILHDEVERSRGPVLVAFCGPSSFSALIRKVVAGEINPERTRKGDQRGIIDIVSEDFDF